MRQLIKDLKIGTKCAIALVVTSVSERKTKAGKPYLQLEFFDGVDKIGGNYWDWGGVKMPEKNAVLDVVCQVTEWQGEKQLNISGLTTCTEYSLAEFAPSSGYDISKVYLDAVELASDIRNDTLRAITVAAFEELRHEWLTVPGAVSVHHAYTGGTLIHSVSVAKVAKAIANVIPDANVDLCVAGALLHDIGKLFTYKLSGLTVDMTTEGKLFEHMYIGMNFISNFADSHVDTDDDMVRRTVQLLVHIIGSHHGRQEYGATVPPQCLEAHIVHHADAVDANCEQVRAESRKFVDKMWTDRIWALDNKAQLTAQYVSEVLREN